MLTKNDLSQIQKVVKTELVPVKKDIKTLKSDVKQIKTTMGTILDVLDREDVAIHKRVKRIEEHVGISSQ